MSSEHNQLGSSILSIEANVIIAGLEGIALGWVLYALGSSQENLFPTNFGSDWSKAAYAVYGTYALLALAIVGFAIEGLAGFLEDKVISRWACYVNTKPPWQSQQRIWESSQSYKDFSRRRLRILVARNTAFSFAVLGLGLFVIFIVKCNILAVALALVVNIGLSALFTHLWIDARKGLKNDIENSGRSRCSCMRRMI